MTPLSRPARGSGWPILDFGFRFLLFFFLFFLESLVMYKMRQIDGSNKTRNSKGLVEERESYPP